MCGIVGTLSFETAGTGVDEDVLRRMRDTMWHRGPDGADLWVSEDRRIGLAHRRLSIVDLSDAAAQPMVDAEGELRIVYNGELYNHVELHRELEERGHHRWKTDHSDTEVVLRAYREWGIDCLQRFRGMFAFGLWDGRERALWIARDRQGVKPVYTSRHHGRISFASEIKALLADPDQPRATNVESMFHYLSFLTTPAPDTMFEGIRKLPPATWMRIGADGTTRQSRYWEVWDHVDPLVGVSDDEIAHRLLDELRSSVRYRKVSDVPVGVFLSGGVDSSTNAVLFSEDEEEPIRTFTVGYQGEYASYTNETAYARRIAEMVGADHHERLLTLDDLLDFLPRMIRLQDEPIGDPVCVPVYYVSKLARDNDVIVCQLGEGSDELFWGYRSWKWALRMQQLDDVPFPRSLKRLGYGALRVAGRHDSRHAEWLRRGTVDLPIFWGGAEAFAEPHKRRLLAPDLRRRFEGFSSWEALRPVRERFERGAWEDHPLHWMSYLDLQLRLPELLLMRVDKMAMGASLEGRVPFLDPEFVSLAMSVPAEVKTRNGTLKHILKRAVEDLLPEEIVHRPKQGFGVPIHEWLLERLGRRARRELDEFCASTGYLDRVEVDRLFEENRAPQVWYLLNFALWWKAYIAEEAITSVEEGTEARATA